MSKTSGWDNNLDYGVTVNEDDIEEFVQEKFNGYSKFVRFRIDETNYKMKALPMQN